MFEDAQLITFVIACCIIVIVPGPTVTVILANSMRYGVHAGLLNVAGTQAGLVIILVVIATGLELIIHRGSVIFDWFRMAGAAYLIWLGIGLYRGRAQSLAVTCSSDRHRSFFWQGFVVIWSNPKALLFLSAFLPQFVDIQGETFVQTLFLGAIFMAVATFFDSIYAFVAGRAGQWLIKDRVRTVELISGTFLIATGIWLLFIQNHP